MKKWYQLHTCCSSYYQQCRIFFGVDIISFGCCLFSFADNYLSQLVIRQNIWCMMFIVRHSNIICPSVKMSTLGLCPRVDILTSGHIRMSHWPSCIICIISLKTRFFDLHFGCRKCWCIFNHFYVIRPESYRIQWNYAAVRAITPFKVIQGHWVWYQSKARMWLPISD